MTPTFSGRACRYLRFNRTIKRTSATGQTLFETEVKCLSYHLIPRGHQGYLTSLLHCLIFVRGKEHSAYIPGRLGRRLGASESAVHRSYKLHNHRQRRVPALKSMLTQHINQSHSRCGAYPENQNHQQLQTTNNSGRHSSLWL